MRASVVVIVAAVAVLSVAAAAPLRLHLNANSRLADSDGRERYFHGLNVVFKGPPYIPIIDSFDPYLSFSQQDVDALTSFGLNAIRLGVMWPGVMPQDGVFNETYLDQMQRILDMAAASNMYALVEVHQDCFSEKLCGEGAPWWAVQVDPLTPAFPLPFAEPYAIDPTTGLPSPADCAKLSWSDYQFSAASADAYQNLYNVGSHANYGFSTHWNRVVQRFKNQTNLLGYELLNEPFAGNLYKDPELMVPGVADRRNLQPFYDNLNSVIRAQDPDCLIWFESTTWDDFVPMGFEHAPGGAAFANRSVVSFHYYYPPNVSPAEQFFSRATDARHLGTGMALTEFNIDPSASTDASTKMTTTMDVADQYFSSWIGWEYKQYIPMTGYGNSIWFANGTYNWPLIKVLARSYPHAVAGTTTSFHFAAATAVFVLEYTVDTTCTLPTDIFVAESVHYVNGYTVDITPANVVKMTSSTNHIFLSPVSSSSNGKFVTVVVRPK
ncbi:endoglycoceramidase [Capsaspora owczarzaki ATCC 30864]|nr:endoglycoceramidase [Capsaspora owczarzaki ATCC 30864]|eukprot:XP_004343119.1 endoglycoceramidase [Capsaspora owczarzaki ATCC 30864]